MTSSADGEVEGAMKLDLLENIINETSEEKLKCGVEVALGLLKDLKSSMLNAKDNPEVAKWINSIEKLQKRSHSPKTVVGVVGSTGSGKSSIINAILDEEMLVPTNCMRACTAVITEISWNSSDDPEQRYRAEIEFISKDAWTHELSILFKELLDGNGHLWSDHRSSESEAGIAYAKIRSVYPDLKIDSLASGRLDWRDLAEEANVGNILGSTKTISARSLKPFYGQLQRLIDSKEKTRGPTNEAEAMEYWPLIKVVRIYVKSAVLSDGLVLVDLVGLHDSMKIYLFSYILTAGTAWQPRSECSASGRCR
jgi:hypothetical protein